MSYRISILDKSPLAAGETAAQALARTLTLAQQAEAWGYHRFWIAEHHNTEQLASPSPELAIAWILGQTRRIRVGSGGVMLQHYSPYKVAENFNMLASLAPGRVDLGVGKAPGGLPLSTRALQQGLNPQQKGSFADQLAQLDNWLSLTETDGKRASAQRRFRRVALTAFSSVPAWKARSWRRSWTGISSSPPISTAISSCCARC
ncbi:luciferase family protein YtmO [Klebsiella michiganensis]|nr:luciferase family protein YtmO [Klebsiella michiganensis]